MPTVRYTGTATRYKRSDGSVDVTQDDPVIDADEETADYLLAETDQFERVDGANADGSASIGDQIEAGECPWCDDYEGDAVGQHAASAHSDDWDAYKED